MHSQNGPPAGRAEGREETERLTLNGRFELVRSGGDFSTATEGRPMAIKDKVCVTRCGKCGLERFGFRPHKTECPRCGRNASGQFERWIAKPAQATIDQAERENHATD